METLAVLNTYFRLFDAARTDESAMNDLLSLFTEDAEIVLNGNSRKGFEDFVRAFYVHNRDVKHMWDGWVLQADGSYHTNWAVCGQTSEGAVYAKTGVDIARFNADGKIAYLENMPTDKDAFGKYTA